MAGCGSWWDRQPWGFGCAAPALLLTAVALLTISVLALGSSLLLGLMRNETPDTVTPCQPLRRAGSPCPSLVDDLDEASLSSSIGAQTGGLSPWGLEDSSGLEIRFSPSWNIPPQPLPCVNTVNPPGCPRDPFLPLLCLRAEPPQSGCSDPSVISH